MKVTVGVTLGVGVEVLIEVTVGVGVLEAVGLGVAVRVSLGSGVSVSAGVGEPKKLHPLNRIRDKINNTNDLLIFISLVARSGEDITAAVTTDRIYTIIGPAGIRTAHSNHAFITINTMFNLTAHVCSALRAPVTSPPDIKLGKSSARPDHVWVGEPGWCKRGCWQRSFSRC